MTRNVPFAFVDRGMVWASAVGGTGGFSGLRLAVERQAVDLQRQQVLARVRFATRKTHRDWAVHHDVVRRRPARRDRCLDEFFPAPQTGEKERKSADLEPAIKKKHKKQPRQRLSTRR